MDTVLDPAMQERNALVIAITVRSFETQKYGE